VYKVWRLVPSSVIPNEGYHRDKGDEQAVFDHGRAVFVVAEVLKNCPDFREHSFSF
jgi:hypothetical protein